MQTKKITASTDTPYISEEEQYHILSLFSRNGVHVLETYEDSNVEDGVRFKEFVVVSDDTNQIRLADLLEDIRRLEGEYDIGSMNESNDNGFYAKDYHFYHYAD